MNLAIPTTVPEHPVEPTTTQYPDNIRHSPLPESLPRLPARRSGVA